jgi:hypothetical protein
MPLCAIPALILSLLENAVRRICGVIIDMADVTNWHQLMHKFQRFIITGYDFLCWNIMTASGNTGGNPCNVDLRVSGQNIVASDKKSSVLCPLQQLEISICGQYRFEAEGFSLFQVFFTPILRNLSRF